MAMVAEIHDHMLLLSDTHQAAFHVCSSLSSIFALLLNWFCQEGTVHNSAGCMQQSLAVFPHRMKAEQPVRADPHKCIRFLQDLFASVAD
jgi:hypothetical protein